MTPIVPPRLARALVRMRLSGARREELEADLDHLFERRLAAHGARYARRRYWRDALSVCGWRDRARLEVPKRDRMLSVLAADVAQAIRALWRRPAFFVIATITLGVGFAAHFAAFRIVDQLLLAPPAHVANPQRLFRLHIDRADGDERFLWYQTPFRSYQDLRAHASSFDGLAAYRTGVASLGAGADARMVRMAYADAHYFPLLGARARIGRVFDASDDGPPEGNAVLVLSDAFWKAAFGGDTSVIGRDVRLGARTFTVIGVMPPGFIGTHAGYAGEGADAIEAWAPLFASAREMPAAWTTSVLYRSVTVLARVREGVAVGQASEEAAATYRRVVDGTDAQDPTARVLLSSLLPGRRQDGTLTPAARVAVWLQGVALLVLLVAIANVVNLQLSRAAQHRREIAVRLALGAGMRRLLSQLVAEIGVIAIASAVLGGVLAWITASALQQLMLPGQPVQASAARLGAAAAISIALAIVTCVGFGMLQLRGPGLSDRLKSGRGGDGFSRARLRQALLVAQVVVSAMLVIGAGLFTRSLTRLGDLRFGMDLDRVLVVQTPLASAGFTSAQVDAFYEHALPAIAQLPGVAHVAAGQTVPFNPSLAAAFTVPGRPDYTARPTYYSVTPDYFAAMGTPILRGRSFSEGDRAGAAPVMIVEQALGDAIWPGQDPIGKCIVIGPAGQPCREIVGVAANTRRFVATPAGSLRYYIPVAQRLANMPPQAMFVRTAGEPRAAIASVRSALMRIDAMLPYLRIRVLRDLAEPETRPWQLGGTLFVAFALVAMLVATAGVYALLSFIVEQRRRELGVRLALGATPVQTIRLVVRQSVSWAAAGAVIGLAGAAACAHLVEPLLFETSPYDPAVFAAAAGLLLLVAAGASALPALRASRVDPTIALKAD